MIVSAPIIILGALAYRSAKKRMLGQVPSTAVRKAAEALAMLLIVLLVILRENLAALAAVQPFHYVLVPAWAIIAYLAVAFRKPRGAVDARVFD
jgi:hypothetical protein